MKISVHLSFNGTCEEAFATYARVFGGRLSFSSRYRDSPVAVQTPPDCQDKIAHATLHVGDLTLMGVDLLFPDYTVPRGVSLAVNVETPEEAHRIYSALAEGGTEVMPIQETYWSAAYGHVTDRFGVAWGINCEQAPAGT